MTPENTNHDSLQVYYDFLEDAGIITEELREFGSKVHWCYELIYGFGIVGNDDGCEIIGFDNDKEIGTIEGSCVGDGSGCLGLTGIFHSVGSDFLNLSTTGVGSSSFK